MQPVITLEIESHPFPLHHLSHMQGQRQQHFLARRERKALPQYPLLHAHAYAIHHHMAPPSSVLLLLLLLRLRSPPLALM